MSNELQIEEGIVYENGKTFYNVGDSYTRQHDKNYDGKHTVYYRCKVCGKLVSRQWQEYHRTLHKQHL